MWAYLYCLVGILPKHINFIKIKISQWNIGLNIAKAYQFYQDQESTEEYCQNIKILSRSQWNFGWNIAKNISILSRSRIHSRILVWILPKHINLIKIKPYRGIMVWILPNHIILSKSRLHSWILVGILPKPSTESFHCVKLFPLKLII